MITIFTPTYNRKALLPRLFASLINQSNLDFEWLIIDDCSNDGTKEYIMSLSDAPFSIRYYKTEMNSGKHIAFNVAIEKALGEYFLCVDSDDFLSIDAISIIYENIKDCAKCIGYIYPRICSALNNDGWKKIDNNLVDIIDTSIIFKIRETAIVIRTPILQKYRFPINFNPSVREKYCPETVLYNYFVVDGKFLAVNKGFYISEYQEGGLTSNIYRLWLNNPFYFILDLKSKYQVYDKYQGIRKIICQSKCIIEYNAFCWKKNIRIFKNTPSIYGSILLFLPGIMFSYIRYRKCSWII